MNNPLHCKKRTIEHITVNKSGEPRKVIFKRSFSLVTANKLFALSNPFPHIHCRFIFYRQYFSLTQLIKQCANRIKSKERIHFHFETSTIAFSSLPQKSTMTFFPSSTMQLLTCTLYIGTHSHSRQLSERISFVIIGIQDKSVLPQVDKIFKL